MANVVPCFQPVSNQPCFQPVGVGAEEREVVRVRHRPDRKGVPRRFALGDPRSRDECLKPRLGRPLAVQKFKSSRSFMAKVVPCFQPVSNQPCFQPVGVGAEEREVVRVRYRPDRKGVPRRFALGDPRSRDECLKPRLGRPLAVQGFIFEIHAGPHRSEVVDQTGNVDFSPCSS